MRAWKMMVLAVLAAAGLATAAAGGPPVPGGPPAAANLQQALDKIVDANIEEAPIPDVFRRLSEKTGVKFVLDDQTFACLPYGDQTRLAVRLRNATLRRDLDRVLAPLALQWSIEGDLVRITPSEALARMCRRASFEELQTLGRLYAEKVPAPAQGGSALDLLRKATGNKDLELLFQGKGGDKAAALAQADRALPATGAEWLDRLSSQGAWTWYLWGDQLVILDRKAQVERQLQQQVSLRYQNEKLLTVLLDLARKAGRVTLIMEPGVMTYVPSEVRTNFNLVMADATIAQALEVISGATGLEFLRAEEGVLRVVPSEKLIQGGLPGAGARRVPFFVRMALPGPGGMNIEVYLRPDELPDDMVQAIEAAKADMIAKWRKANPTTQPTLVVPRDVNH